MKSVSRESDLIATIAYCALMPGFFLYHFSVGKGLIGAFLGGYSTITAAMLIPVLVYAYYKRLKTKAYERSILDVFFVGYVLYYMITLCAAIALHRNMQNAMEQLGIIPQFISMFAVSRLLPYSNLVFRKLNLALLILISCVIILNAAEGSFIIATLDILEGADNLASYQAYALMYTIMLVFALGQMASGRIRLLLYLLSLPTLFLNGARTEFIGMFLISMILEFVKAKNKIVLLSIVGTLMAISPILIPSLQDILPNNRVLVLFSDNADDTSAIERGIVFRKGFETIANHPFFGDFGSYAQGQYIHNALSSWVDLGLVGFLWYASLILIPLIVLAKNMFADVKSPSGTTVFLFSCLLLLFAVTAKHYSYQLLPIMFGVFLQHQALKKRENIEIKMQGKKLL